MADLAGFDAIVEIHKDTIVDWVNLFPVADPGGGRDIRLLGGPFSIELPLVVPNVGSTTVYLILDIALEPLVHQPAARLIVTLRSGSCMLLGRGIDHIGGSFELDVPLVCQPRPGNAANDAWQIFVQFPLAQMSALQYDAVTAAKLHGFLPPPLVTSFTNSLVKAIWALAPPLPLDAPYFRVVPGIDSESPLQFSSVPTAAWIDAFTLGLFGYYSSGTGGSLSAKKEGDLDQASDEFMYGLPGPEPMVASRRMALLMSAEAAHRVLLCPLIREGVVRPLKLKQQTQELAEAIHTDQYQKIYDAQFLLHYASYLHEEWLRENAGPFVDYYEAAKREKLERADRRAVARIQDDVQAEINRRAGILMTIPYFSSMSVVKAAVPPPCGTGTVHAFNQPVDEFSVQSKSIIGVLQEFDLVLDEARLLGHYKADAFIEDVLGDVTGTVEGEVEITLDVDYWGAILAHVNVLEPRVSEEASGLTGVLVGIVKGVAPGAWAAMLTIAGVLLQQELQKIINRALAASLPASGLGAAPPPPAPIALNVGKLQQRALDAIASGISNPTVAGALQAAVASMRARDIQITKTSFALFALVARHANYNVFSPSISLPFDKFLTASTEPSIDGSLHLPKTDWGCPEETFDTKRVFWNTEIRVRARYHDLDMPLTAVRWSIDIGNFTFSSIGKFSFVNPGIKWSGSPATLQTAVLHLTGVVNHPDSPLTRVEGLTFPMGHMFANTDVEVTVSGDGTTGWSIRFRGTDGNFYVRLMLDAVDGLSVPRHGEAIIQVKGDELQLHELYADYKSMCDAKYKAYRQFKAATDAPRVELAPIAPGDDVTRLQEVVSDLHRSIQAGEPAAVKRLETFHRQYGHDALLALPRLTGRHFATKE